jgi:protein-S-isoprenylcysteine O-methyltransferase Ste14
MNAFRYYLALVYAMILPPAILLWLVIHPFVGLWRKVGLFGTYLAVTAVAGAGATGLYALRRTLLAVEFGTHWPLLVLGLGSVAAAMGLRVRLHRHFSNQQMMGLPELAPDRYPQRLVAEGLHAQVRHPRYLQFLWPWLDSR